MSDTVITASDDNVAMYNKAQNFSKKKKKRRRSTYDKYGCMPEKVRYATGQYIRSIDGFTTCKKCIGINLIPVTVSQ
jgi:hypothetical protein